MPVKQENEIDTLPYGPLMNHRQNCPVLVHVQSYTWKHNLTQICSHAWMSWREGILPVRLLGSLPKHQQSWERALNDINIGKNTALVYSQWQLANSVLKPEGCRSPVSVHHNLNSKGQLHTCRL